jgi:hypothetical protein
MAHGTRDVESGLAGHTAEAGEGMAQAVQVELADARPLDQLYPNVPPYNSGRNDNAPAKGRLKQDSKSPLSASAYGLTGGGTMTDSRERTDAGQPAATTAGSPSGRSTAASAAKRTFIDPTKVRPRTPEEQAEMGQWHRSIGKSLVDHLNASVLADAG